MNSRDFCYFVVYITVLYCMTGFSISGSEKAAFAAINCTKDEHCDNVCFTGGYLYNRCDSNGTCVCDCSEPEEIPSSYASACAIPQPDGYWRDYCDKYCNAIYLRPFRYCNNSEGFCYCTCVCNVNH